MNLMEWEVGIPGKQHVSYAFPYSLACFLLEVVLVGRLPGKEDCSSSR